MDQMPQFPPVKHDLQTRHGTIYGEEERAAILECLAQDAPTSGKKVEEFERRFAEYIGTKYAITVSNGTAALNMAFKALDIEPGDEVITTPVTWIATAAAAVVFGARIRFADTDPRTLNIDPASVASLITPKTKAICPVHLYGQAVDMDPLLEVARSHQIPVVEDAAHAPGGTYRGRKVGNLGEIACFSFHEQKNMSTLGEGGMITTNDPDLYARARLYKSHCARVIGGSSKYMPLSVGLEREALARDQYWYQDFDDCGFNFRMNDMAATVGLCQLEKLDEMNARRNAIAAQLTGALAEIPGVIPLETLPRVYHTYHLYPVYIKQGKECLTREAFIFRMRQKYRIKCGVHYMPLVRTQAFMKYGHTEAECPSAVEYWAQLVTLPIHPRLTDEAVNYLIESVGLCLKNN